ncbi:MAG: hypothetical protein RL318_1082 [Fibrobacterota bacterium]|jgi:hypothetical protein
MQTDELPQTPLETYKAIIDEFVDISHSRHADLVLESGIYSKNPAHDELNEFVQTLSPRQRILLANILNEERQCAIHDVLANVSWWIDSREVGLTCRGEAMPVQLAGMGLHGDYVGRLDEREWPA